MGKGTIISGGTDGQYQIDYKVDKTRMQARITAIESDIEVLTEVEIPKLEADVTLKETEHSNLLVQLNTAINLSNNTTEITKALSRALSALNAAKSSLNAGKLKLGSLTQEKKYLTDNLPADQQIAAWCADLNENLTGDVGTIEIPGERTAPVIIKPGGADGLQAVYNAANDGQIAPILGLSPSEAFYNLAMMPGWQKYQPTYRLGVITNLNGNLCDITLDAAVSSLQDLGVNQSTTLSNVPITYLSCDGAAFAVTDRVVVKFTGTGPGTPYTPSVIGFESNPKACELSPTYFYREREVSRSSISQAHTDFLVEPWSSWIETDATSHPPYYLGIFSGPPDFISTYKGRELKLVVTVPASGTWSVQAREEAAPVQLGGSKTYLESDPSRFGLISAFNVWQEMFTLTGADAGIITAIMTDKDAWELGDTFSLGLEWKGWQGHTNGALQIII